MVSGTEKDREHWRFVSVQTRGCHSATRRSDKQREQQRQLAGYLAIRECEVVGMGDTRLGGDASDIARLTRTALNGLYNDATITTAYDEAAGPADRVQSRSGAAIHDNDTNTVRGTRPGQDPVGHDVGATDPAELDSNIYDDTNTHNNTNTNDDERDAQPPAAQSAARSRLRVGLAYGAAGSHPCGEAACCLVRSARRTGARRGASATAEAGDDTSVASIEVPPRRRWLWLRRTFLALHTRRATRRARTTRRCSVLALRRSRPECRPRDGRATRSRRSLVISGRCNPTTQN